ncbi:MAG: SufE family protein [Pseudomonadota bacterium]
MSLERLVDDFALLPDWEERYRYVIELGKAMPPLADADKTDATKVQGCVSQVWIKTAFEPGPPEKLTFNGDSDAMIVKGLIAILKELYDGASPADILALDARDALGQLGLEEHLTPQRSNGLFSMVERIRRDAKGVAGN